MIRIVFCSITCVLKYFVSLNFKKKHPQKGHWTSGWKYYGMEWGNPPPPRTDWPQVPSQRDTPSPSTVTDPAQEMGYPQLGT